MKKSDLNKFISTMAKDKKVLWYDDWENMYFANGAGYFIIKTNREYGSYIIDKLSTYKRVPEWSQSKMITKFFAHNNAQRCRNVFLGEKLPDKRQILNLSQDKYTTRINKQYSIDGGEFYTTSRNGPVYEILDSTEIAIMPIFTPEDENDKVQSCAN